ncbi:hypothetical protein HY388_01975 [Candidatus Daviesbacteria bacterium]|nr:hypothetical protein [Candidatus Daviesbacteria bacterium]
MRLYEFEARQLLKDQGVNVPDGKLITSVEDLKKLPADYLVVKAQVLTGGRQKGNLVRIRDNAGQVAADVKELLSEKDDYVSSILVCQKITSQKEYYVSFSYDTSSRTPVLAFSDQGGVDIEDAKKVKIYPIDPLTDFDPSALPIPKDLVDTVAKLYQVFVKYDCELVEVNPLVVDTAGQILALDAKIILDDDADFRREANPDLIGVKFPERNLFGRASTEAEIEARTIDEGDHRGTAGSVYWDLPGDIAVLAAGGGGSIVCMDALIALGGKPANYTEHSGNPPREKIKQLTKIILAKSGLKGCWVVGGTANFTDIYETLMGFVEGLRETSPKPGYPIVIRRGGPRDREAFEALKEIGKKEGYDFHIYGRETPMTATAKTIVELAYGKGERGKG